MTVVVNAPILARARETARTPDLRPFGELLEAAETLEFHGGVDDRVLAFQARYAVRQAWATHISPAVALTGLS